MKKIILFILFFISMVSWSQQQTVSYSVSPGTFDENQSVTLTFQGSSINEGTWGVAGNALYLWSWSYDINDTNSLDCPTNGTWTASNEANRLTYNSGNDTYTITFSPTTFYSRTGIGRIGFLIKAKNGTGDKKSQDIYAEVGTFQANLTSPGLNSNTIISSGGNLNITANNTNGNANYILLANGTQINTFSGSSYSYNDTNITTNKAYELIITQGVVTFSKKFNVIINPGTISQAIPAGLEDGINYNPGDATRATLVLTAPGKDFVYVAGSFNNYQPSTAYAMKKDPVSGKFWLELTGLTPGQSENYQYWVVDQTPIANSPSFVKAADPYSTLVLSPYDDPWTPVSTYPNMPVYPAGQEREVTVLQTGQTAYPWINTSFTKPKKEDLIVYEALIRDFDSDRNFQDLIDKISYFKNLKINAIELMPVMEFEGNESWGYNTSFHMALDKHYGPSAKLKEFVDLCHSNGIAVILDIAFNHAFGRNPMVRMWMNDPDGDGWGDPSTENPYFNTVARHSYSVGSDFNHASAYTKEYVKKVTKYWIQEFKIDGFRWDLTKGFTQNCSAADESCTNSYQADRVAVLKEYVDNCWTADPTHYAIFEHLGTENEEKEWANYRIAENPSKGVMMWGEMTSQYEPLIKGVAGADITGIGHKSRASFLGKRLLGYPESHDKERLVYTAMTTGNAAGAFPVYNNLPNTLNRMSAIGAVSILVPGPKMIWHFADLGMDDSIYTCSNGTVNTESDPTSGDCKLATKPQPQWTENWLTDPTRNTIYNNWTKFNILKTQEAVFEGDYTINTDGSTVKQRLYVFDNALPASTLKNVVVLANFSVANLTINPNFPYAGTWYNLIDGTSMNVTDTQAVISVPSGGFRIYGNQPAQSLNNEGFNLANSIVLYPNPSNGYFNLSEAVKTVEIYNLTGQLVKTFKGGFAAQHNFSVENLNSGLYFVKLTNETNQQGTIKLIKE
ncbi:alpha-amylase family glycosyl hydrolase [Flavobacterium amniphilum]|uniref:alpha-amylase family glycosyl hydrolase n=1 Tax=Flavobacterium amniphilum TaxID=1834035 RepID=UPI00202A0B30|nr:alpha-amylase family glycosyl hydrolase [Flavobacterium amniphilum]MCL9806494.1 alpha-amylase family glycosyl hydrolase [Flavobacterium amniphilum]